MLEKLATHNIHDVRELFSLIDKCVCGQPRVKRGKFTKKSCYGWQVLGPSRLRLERKKARPPQLYHHGEW